MSAARMKGGSTLWPAGNLTRTILATKTRCRRQGPENAVGWSESWRRSEEEVHRAGSCQPAESEFGRSVATTAIRRVVEGRSPGLKSRQ